MKYELQVLDIQEAYESTYLLGLQRPTTIRLFVTRLQNLKLDRKHSHGPLCGRVSKQRMSFRRYFEMVLTAAWLFLRSNHRTRSSCVVTFVVSQDRVCRTTANGDVSKTKLAAIWRPSPDVTLIDHACLGFLQ